MSDDSETFSVIMNDETAATWQRMMVAGDREWARLRRNFMAQARRRNLTRVSVRRGDGSEIEVMLLRGAKR